MLLDALICDFHLQSAVSLKVKVHQAFTFLVSTGNAVLGAWFIFTKAEGLRREPGSMGLILITILRIKT